MRLFHLGDILSITTERLVSPRLMSGVYDILNYMTQDSLMTHQLPRASSECKPWLLRQHPQLVGIDASTFDTDTWRQWLEQQIELYGEELMVEPIPQDDHDRVDPLVELEQMFGADRVIRVVVNNEDA